MRGVALHDGISDKLAKNPNPPFAYPIKWAESWRKETLARDPKIIPKEGAGPRGQSHDLQEAEMAEVLGAGRCCIM